MSNNSQQPRTTAEQAADFNYMLLGRLRQDCEYYLGFGNRNVKRLWAGSEVDQISKMRELYESLPEKPEWISLEKIEQYERAMVGSAAAAAPAPKRFKP